MFKAEVQVMLRPAILDVQGKAVENSLHSLGHTSIGNVRVGKNITLMIEAANPDEAEKIAREVAKSVLSNPVIEDFYVTITTMDEVESAA